MGKKAKAEPREEDTVRITVDLPRPLWRALKIRCMDDTKSLQALTRELFTAYLKDKGGTR